MSSNLNVARARVMPTYDASSKQVVSFSFFLIRRYSKKFFKFFILSVFIILYIITPTSELNEFKGTELLPELLKMLLTSNFR